MKEGASINKSLLTLGTVINKLSEGVQGQGEPVYASWVWGAQSHSAPTAFTRGSMYQRDPAPQHGRTTCIRCMQGLLTELFGPSGNLTMR